MEKKRRIQGNPLKYARLHDKQKEASSAQKTLRALFWGNRVGKTEWGATEAAKIVLGEHPFIPPSDGWIFCPSFDEQKDTTQLKLLRYIPENRIVDRTWLRKGILKELVVESGTGKRSKITFKSYEQGRDKAQGAGKGWIWFDEEPPKDIFDECSVRSEAGHPLYLWMTMTPIKGLTWVYDSIYLNTSNPDIFVSTATWDDNPFLTEEQKEKMAARLSSAALKVRREGKFMRQVGLVASWFDRTIHVMDFDEIPDGEFYMGIDFGFSNPACGLWVSVSANEDIWVFDGFYGTGMTNPDILSACEEKEEFIKDRRITRIADSAQASDIKELNDAGYRIQGVEKQSGTKHENWDEWRAKLMEDVGRIDPEDPEKKHPRILISSKLVAYDEDGNPFNFLVKELENLRWEEVKTDTGTAPKSVWGKQPNHACFAAGTPILTPNGWQAIETIRVGDYVTTPFGPSFVLESASTGVKPVIDFCGMKATPDHPILTKRGFVPIDALRYTDTVCTMGSPKSSWLTESDSDVTPTHRSVSLGSIIAALQRRCSAEKQRGSTSIYGKGRTAQFLKDMWFIISTIILSTTSWITCNSKHLPIMRESTWTRNGESFSATICSPLSMLLRRNGTGAKKALSFINGLVSRLGRLGHGFPLPASNAEKNTSHISQHEQSSAEEHVPKPIQESVEVFALKTAHGMFTANGIVVSNCDALTYILATIENERKRGTGRVLRTGGNPIINTQITPTAQSIIDAMKKANQRPKDVWEDF